MGEGKEVVFHHTAICSLIKKLCPKILSFYFLPQDDYTVIMYFLSNFPPPYTVRVSKRAKRISLRIRPSSGLEIILPQNVSDTDPYNILTKFKPWIERHYGRVMGKGVFSRKRENNIQPKNFFLYGGKIYVILQEQEKNALARQVHEREVFEKKEYCNKKIGDATFSLNHKGKTFTRREFIAAYPEVLHPPFTSGSGDITVCYLYFKRTDEHINRYIKKWLKQWAQKYITPMIQEESRKYFLPYNKLSFRFQKTRWGSCSSKKNINLNVNLVFLPEHLIRYIILHELSHTKVMNHSEQYWKVLFSLDEQALKHDKAMRGAWRYVPPWILSMM